MNRSRRILFLSYILTCLVNTSVAQEPIPDAVYLKLVKEYTLNADGSMDYHYIKTQQLLTYRATSSLYGETFIVYNPSGQTLKINGCFTTMANGKKITAPSNSFNEVLPGFAANAPAYNNLREMVVTHTGVERNCILNLDYTLHSLKGFYPAFMGNEILSETEPVQELILKISMPANEKLYWTPVCTKEKPEITRNGDQTVYAWHLRNVAAQSAEEFQEGGNAAYPRILFTSLSDRRRLYSDLVSRDEFNYSINGEMKQKVEDILGESHEKTDLLIKLQELVVNEIRLWPIPLRYTGYRFREPQQTWNSNGGTLMEKALLLSALLKEAGINACPVFVIRFPQFDEKAATLLDVEDILVKAETTETGPVYLSVASLNAQNLTYNLPGRILISLDERQEFSRKGTEEYHNRVRCEGAFKVGDKEQLTGDLSYSFLNGCNPWLALLKDQHKAKSFISGGIVPGDLKEVKVGTIHEEESFFSYSVEKQQPFRKDSTICFFTLPYLSNGTEAWGIHLLPAERTTSFEIPGLLEESYDYSFDIPATMTLLNPQEKLRISNPAGTFEFELRKEKDKVILRKNLSLSKRIIPPDEYPDFKALMDHWNSNRYKELILEE